MEEEELQNLIKKAQNGDREATRLILTAHRDQVSCGTLRNGALNALARSVFPKEQPFAKALFLEDSKKMREQIEDRYRSSPIVSMLADIAVTHFAANQIFQGALYLEETHNPASPLLTEKSRRLTHQHSRLLRTLGAIDKHGKPS